MADVQISQISMEEFFNEKVAALSAIIDDLTNQLAAARAALKQRNRQEEPQASQEPAVPSGA